MRVDLIVDLGGDVCAIVGADDNGQPIACTNWTSATWNHYPPEAYDENGNRVDPNAPGRDMTEDEMLAWAENLLRERGAPVHGPAAILYQAPEAE